MADDNKPWCKGETALAPGNKDIYVQLVLSFALGISAFIGFCVSPCSGSAVLSLDIDAALTILPLLRSFVLDGKRSMPRGSDTKTPKSPSQFSPIAF
jgi:hypothetical protein